MWAVGIQSWSSGGAVSVLNLQAISPAPNPLGTLTDSCQMGIQLATLSKLSY